MQSCLGITELIGTVANVFLIKLLGKRHLFIGSMALAGLSGIALSIDAFKIIPIAASTFDETYVNTNRSMDNTFALVAFIVMDFFSSVASGMPWMLISEIFPIRVRAAAAGLSASVAYLSMFGLTITYIHVEAALSIGGAAMAYSVLTLIGLVFLFWGVIR